jgi:hypothetical protein
MLGWELYETYIHVETYLSHCDDDPGQFNIRIEIRHSLFGTSFTQTGVFHEILD